MPRNGGPRHDCFSKFWVEEKKKEKERHQGKNLKGRGWRVTPSIQWPPFLHCAQLRFHSPSCPHRSAEVLTNEMWVQGSAGSMVRHTLWPFLLPGIQTWWKELQQPLRTIKWKLPAEDDRAESHEKPGFLSFCPVILDHVSSDFCYLKKKEISMLDKPLLRLLFFLGGGGLVIQLKLT